MRVFGAGINYTFGQATVGFAYTNSNYKNPTGNGYLGTPGAIIAPGATVSAIKYQNFEVNGSYQVTPAFMVGAQYVLSLEKYDASTGNAKPKIHSAGLMADYNLSKRTDVRAGRVPAHRRRQDELDPRQRVHPRYRRAVVDVEPGGRARRAAPQVLM